MDQRRFILFLTLSMAILIGWMNVGPVLFPGLFPKPRKPVVKKQEPADAKAGAKDDQQAESKDDQSDDKKTDKKEKVAETKPEKAKQPKDADAPADQSDKKKPAEVAAASAFSKNPLETVKLGSLDPKSGYFMEVELSTRGAAVTRIALNDPRYSDLNDRQKPLLIVGNDPLAKRQTLGLSIPQIDGQLKEFATNLRTINWQIEADSQTDSAVTFQMTSPDGKLRVRKHFELKQLDKGHSGSKQFRDTQPEGYWLTFAISIENLGDEQQAVSYTLQGPVGLPLENEENTSKFRDIRMGFFQEGEVETASLTAAKIVDATEAEELEEWKQPLKYIGIDVQYFAALLTPHGDQQKTQTVAIAKPILVGKPKTPKTFSDISVELLSDVIPLAEGDQITHTYTLFAGPKRQELLQSEPFGAGDIVDFGWFASVSVAMLWVMNTFHGWGIPYGIAIIMLTVMVRGCMLPLSMKQAAGAKKMKELQPKIAELKKKYANEKEKMAKAQMELFSKNNYNPFAGCLPIFVQLPIFIGLYRSLGSSVDLRMAPFLWVKNLAAPDAMFQLPFQLPFLQTQAFNLLPLVTVGLFIAQQKMFMPPPTDDQQAMQQKMMNYMMIFFGFMFYKVPAGLCVYFIASSCWGMAERKILDLKKPSEPTEIEEKPQSGKKSPTKPGLWARLGEQVAEAQKKIDSPDSQTKSNGAKSGFKKKKKKSRR